MVIFGDQYHTRKEAWHRARKWWLYTHQTLYIHRIRGNKVLSVKPFVPSNDDLIKSVEAQLAEIKGKLL